MWIGRAFVGRQLPLSGLDRAVAVLPQEKGFGSSTQNPRRNAGWNRRSAVGNVVVYE